MCKTHIQCTRIVVNVHVYYQTYRVTRVYGRNVLSINDPTPTLALSVMPCRLSTVHEGERGGGGGGGGMETRKIGR